MAKTPGAIQRTPSGAPILTPSMQKLIDVILDCECEDMTTKQRAEAAGITEQTYYRTMADLRFQEAMKNRAFTWLIPEMPTVLQSAVRAARMDGRDGFKDREMLMRMVRWYEPASKQEVTGPGGGAVEVRFVPPGLAPGADLDTLDIDPETLEVRGPKKNEEQMPQEAEEVCSTLDGGPSQNKPFF
jgi:hypothetical protein